MPYFLMIEDDPRVARNQALCLGKGVETRSVANLAAARTQNHRAEPWPGAMVLVGVWRLVVVYVPVLLLVRKTILQSKAG